MMIYLQLFFEFFKAGLFAIGGGMATLPFLYDISDKTGWFTYGQLADMVAISESTPRPHRRQYAYLCGLYHSWYPWFCDRHFGPHHSVHHHYPDHRRLFKGLQG